MSSTRNPTVLYGVQVLQTKLCKTHIRQVFNILQMQSQTTFWEASLSRLIKVRQTWTVSFWSEFSSVGPKAPAVSSLSVGAQDEIKKITTHAIASQMKEMLPQILAAVAAALNLTPK